MLGQSATDVAIQAPSLKVGLEMHVNLLRSMLVHPRI
jgi:hypothetical protein